MASPKLANHHVRALPYRSVGVLSDLVVAPAGSAEAILRAMVPSQQFDGIDVKGIDSVKLGTLHSILSGRTFEELLPEYAEVASGGDEGPWVFELPADLVNRLSGLSADQSSQVSAQWALTEEFALDGWVEVDVTCALEAIAQLAARAAASDQRLYLWMSL